MEVQFNTRAICQVWMDCDPAEGRSEWYDDETGWLTHDRREALSWVKENGRGLRHSWRLD